MTTTEIIFGLLTALFGAATIVAKTRGARRQVLVAKPLTMAMVVATYLAGDAGGPRGAVWALVGVAFVASIVGDVLLELESDRFVAGLVSFLAAHVAYVAAFGLRAAETPGFATRPAYWVPLAVLGAYGAATYRMLGPGLGEMRVPVAVYVGVITLMAWQATGAFLLRPDAPSALALAGAALFMTSDTLLAFDRFRAPVPASHALVLGTYFAAQWLIAVSVNGW
jgi:uncharacterized membrane protein YhhN